MISFFADPYKDELIYSAIARYHNQVGNLDMKDTLEEMFATRTRVATLEIGANFEKLRKLIGNTYTSDYIIREHTIFNYYDMFLPTRRKMQLIDTMKHSNAAGIYAQIGLIAGGVCQKKGIYYCPECMKLELEQLGECYIHREHQLQGINMCMHHRVWLEKYKLDRTNTSRILFIRLEEVQVEPRRVQEGKELDILFKLAQMAYQLLNIKKREVGRENILKRYKDLLYAKGLITPSGRVRQKELSQEFSSFYSKEVLELLESELNEESEYNWLKVMLRNAERVVHPIRHLLFINFLIGDIGMFFEDVGDEYNPFGKGEWPCLNPVAVHYKQNIISSITIKTDSKSKLPVGTFTCECGFSYSRTGPDKYQEDRYRIGRIKEFGEVWEEMLKRYLHDNVYGLREIAKIMKCDPKTILKFDEKLSLNYFTAPATKMSREPINKEKDNRLDEYKDGLLAVIKSNPHASRNKIRSLLSKAYTYIYRKDKAWLDNNMPPKTKSIGYNRSIDWEERDKELLQLLRCKVDEILNLPKPIRLTKASLGRTVGKLSIIEKKLDKLPLTKGYLESVCESIEAYQIRRCNQIIRRLEAEGKEVKEWEVQRIAGIRKDKFEVIKNRLNSGGGTSGYRK